MGFALPEGLRPRDLLLVGMTAGVGLTVALFIACAAFADPALQGAAKMALFSASPWPCRRLGWGEFCGHEAPFNRRGTR